MLILIRILPMTCVVWQIMSVLDSQMPSDREVVCGENESTRQVAQRVGCSPEQLVELNRAAYPDITVNSNFEAGTVLSIPGGNYRQLVNAMRSILEGDHRHAPNFEQIERCKDVLNHRMLIWNVTTLQPCGIPSALLAG